MKPNANMAETLDTKTLSRQVDVRTARRAHQVVADDARILAQVQASLDDPRPSVPDDEARVRFAARKAVLRQTDQ